MRDHLVLARQILRDFGLSRVSLRQLAKLLVMGLRPPTGPVVGIRRRPERDYSMRVPFGFITPDSRPSGIRVLAACHVFHAALAGEFRDILARVSGRLDVVMSTDTARKRAEIIAAFADWPKGSVEVRVVENRGRDIAPKLTAYNDLYDHYDLVLYLHTKSNTHLVDGSEWRRYLVQTLVGTPDIAASIIEAFHRDPSLGVVLPQHWPPIRGWIDWSKDYQAAHGLAHRMGIKLTPTHVIDFPSGSMFWARPAALRKMLDLGLSPQDFPDETGQLESTPAHALERLFLFACEASGYRWAKVSASALDDCSGAAIAINTADDLASYSARYDFRLTAAPRQPVAKAHLAR